MSRQTSIARVPRASGLGVCALVIGLLILPL
jgi:hypothetical protein